MNRRNFLRGTRNAISVMAVAALLKGKSIDYENGPIEGFGLATAKPEGAGILYDGSEARLLQDGIRAIVEDEYQDWFIKTDLEAGYKTIFRKT